MKIKRLFFIAIAVMLMGATASASGFKFGIKAGANFNSLHFSEEGLKNDFKDSDNRTGYNLGVMCEFTVPIIGIGVDASVMYVHRPTLETQDGSQKFKRDYLEIPVNLKYKLGLPAVSHIISPYIFTGPSFAFKMSKSEIENLINDKKCDIAWNLGLGVELVKHVQIGASYGWGITKIVNKIAKEGEPAGTGRNNCWTVTAEYLF